MYSYAEALEVLTRKSFHLCRYIKWLTLRGSFAATENHDSGECFFSEIKRSIKYFEQYYCLN